MDSIERIRILKEVELLRTATTGQQFNTANDRVNNIEERIEALETTDNSVGDNDEVIRLIETIREALHSETRRGKTPLFVETYREGNNAVTHPDVIKLKIPLSGYKYWMAYTPHPNSTGENPCIACSNDGINWITPEGVNNPLDRPSKDKQQYTLSDTALVFNEMTEKLECWYRATNNDATKSITLWRRVSSDGIYWEEAEEMYHRTDTKTGLISPSILRENGGYVMWASTGGGGKYTSPDGKQWTYVGKVLIDGEDRLIRGVHFNVKYSNTLNQYELVYSDYANIYHCVSDDGINFVNRQTLITRKSEHDFDGGKYYRPSWFIDNGQYYFYYAYMSKDWCWGITLSISEKEDIFDIQGIDESYNHRMAGMTHKPSTSGITGRVLFDANLGKMIYCEVGGNNAIWKDFNGDLV